MDRAEEELDAKAAAEVPLEDLRQLGEEQLDLTARGTADRDGVIGYVNGAGRGRFGDAEGAVSHHLELNSVPRMAAVTVGVSMRP